MTDELNPNHPVTAVMRGEWHKIATLLMLKFGEKHVVITDADVQGLTTGLVIAVQELPDGLHVKVIDQDTADRLVREHRGRAH